LQRALLVLCFLSPWKMVLLKSPYLLNLSHLSLICLYFLMLFCILFAFPSLLDLLFPPFNNLFSFYIHFSFYSPSFLSHAVVFPFFYFSFIPDCFQRLRFLEDFYLNIFCAYISNPSSAKNNPFTMPFPGRGFMYNGFAPADAGLRYGKWSDIIVYESLNRPKALSCRVARHDSVSGVYEKFGPRAIRH